MCRLVQVLFDQNVNLLVTHQLACFTVTLSAGVTLSSSTGLVGLCFVDLYILASQGTVTSTLLSVVPTRLCYIWLAFLPSCKSVSYLWTAFFTLLDAQFTKD